MNVEDLLQKVFRHEELTADEVVFVQEQVYAMAKTADEKSLLFLHERVIQEYARGQRCGVCAHTHAQCAAENHDCTYGC